MDSKLEIKATSSGSDGLVVTSTMDVPVFDPTRMQMHEDDRGLQLVSFGESTDTGRDNTTSDME